VQFRKHQKQEERQSSPKPENHKKNPISLEIQKTRNHKKTQEPKNLQKTRVVLNSKLNENQLGFPQKITNLTKPKEQKNEQQHPTTSNNQLEKKKRTPIRINPN